MTDSPFPPFMPNQSSPPTAPEQPPKGKRIRKATETPSAPVAEKPTRKPRGPNKLKAHAPKFDLQTTLAAAQSLNEADFPLFEKLVLMLDEAGKPARDRLLAAIGKVFG